MEYIVSAATDVGLVKKINQDSFGVKVLDTKHGKIAVAVLCDGMGGLSKGETASATVVDAFHKWILNRLPYLCEIGITDSLIQNEWINTVMLCNKKINSYGKNTGIELGTTLTVMMITDTRYFIMNIGDSRAYEITDQVMLLTKDHTLVAREVEMGILTEEQARTDARKNVLLQCVGASKKILPDIFFGKTKENAVYMLCSDGFRHEITREEIYHFLNPSVMLEAIQMKQNMEELIEINKLRRERDNITAVSIRTCKNTLNGFYDPLETLMLYQEKSPEVTEIIGDEDFLPLPENGLPVINEDTVFSVIEEFSFTSSYEIIE